MKLWAMLKETCDSAARQWVLAATPNREPEPYETETYINKRWVRVTIDFNGEKKPPCRRAGDAGELTSDRREKAEPTKIERRLEQYSYE